MFRSFVLRSLRSSSGVAATSARSQQSVRNSFFAAVAGTAGAAAFVLCDRSITSSGSSSLVRTALAQEETRVVPFNVFRVRVMPVWYRIAIVVLSAISGGLLYPFVLPVILFNHLEEAVPKMSVAGKTLAWRGVFSEFYAESMKSLGLTLVTFGFYHILGYADERMESYIDAHIDFKND
jgi:hypothetical protein